MITLGELSDKLGPRFRLFGYTEELTRFDASIRITENEINELLENTGWQIEHYRCDNFGTKLWLEPIPQA